MYQILVGEGVGLRIHLLQDDLQRNIVIINNLSLNLFSVICADSIHKCCSSVASFFSPGGQRGGGRGIYKGGGGQVKQLSL